MSVSVHHFLDGGTIGIEISNATGCKEQFAIPCHLGSNGRYERVFVGALHDREPKALEVANPTATKQALVYILAQHRNDDPYVDAALAKLADRPLDHARCLLHHYQGRYNQ